MPITRHLILPRGTFRRSELPPHPAPRWSDVKDTLAVLGLTVTQAPGQVTLTTAGSDELYMAGMYPTTTHVTHRLMAITSRLLVRALQMDAARTSWNDGDDLTRNQIEVWAQQDVRNTRGGPFDRVAALRIRRAKQVSFLPEEWLVRLPELAAAFPLSTPMRAQLRELLRFMARDALDSAVPKAGVASRGMRRL
ncbi:hypothetical protein [Luteibacter sp. 9135]|uniref:hypothetical protein n=1 Tax=Luteibacter sp. 9135 TaxID=1500893 RepID=UPI0005611355|nr:hypothetical protein [Luteibacter sp. 9135]